MRQAEHLVNRAGMEKAKDSAEFDTAHARTQHNPYTHCNGFCANVSLVVVVVLFGFLVHTVVQNASWHEYHLCWILYLLIIFSLRDSDVGYGNTW